MGIKLLCTWHRHRPCGHFLQPAVLPLQGYGCPGQFRFCLPPLPRSWPLQSGHLR
ncbi:hypothetical protein EVA_19625 [gut metagenome]|uniref:Uncharacterized protein n=1 Tax=gut metagenome TaxID=749906 RepID=J9FCW8_9ZZZZ